jgi:hypothetical protein
MKPVAIWTRRASARSGTESFENTCATCHSPPRALQHQPPATWINEPHELENDPTTGPHARHHYSPTSRCLGSHMGWPDHDAGAPAARRTRLVRHRFWARRGPHAAGAAGRGQELGDTSRCDVFGVPRSDAAKLRLAVLAGWLRAAGVRVDLAYGDRGLKGAMRWWRGIGTSKPARSG